MENRKFNGKTVKKVKFGEENSLTFINDIKELLIQEEVCEMADFIVNFFETSHLFNVKNHNIYLKFLEQQNKVERLVYTNGCYELQSVMYYDSNIFLFTVYRIISQLNISDLIIEFLENLAEETKIYDINEVKELYLDDSILQINDNEAIHTRLDGNDIIVTKLDKENDEWLESYDYIMVIENNEEYISNYNDKDFTSESFHFSPN